MQDRRAEAGLRLFRALLAADLDLQKKATANNQLLIAFVYGGDTRRAKAAATAFASGDIRGMTVAAEATNDATFASFGGRVPAGIFILDALPKPALQAVIRYGIEHHVIVYSPIEGDVENGVLAGLSIEAQVRPFLNQATLEASHIAIKPFFLKVSKVYQ